MSRDALGRVCVRLRDRARVGGVSLLAAAHRPTGEPASVASHLRSGFSPGEFGGQLGAAGETNLPEHVGEMRLDGATGDVQPRADIWVRQSLGDEVADSGFHRSQ